jgi:hypothetical protein
VGGANVDRDIRRANYVVCVSQIQIQQQGNVAIEHFLPAQFEATRETGASEKIGGRQMNVEIVCQTS